MAPQAFVTGIPVVSHKTSFTAPAVCKGPAHRAASPGGRAQWTMAKVSEFGPFSPAVIATKLIVGEKKLNKARAKGISLHAQTITAFCKATGAEPKTRQNLIRTAKNSEEEGPNKMK